MCYLITEGRISLVGIFKRAILSRKSMTQIYVTKTEINKIRDSKEIRLKILNGADVVLMKVVERVSDDTYKYYGSNRTNATERYKKPAITFETMTEVSAIYSI